MSNPAQSFNQLCSRYGTDERECCRISPPRFLAEYHKKRLNQAGFVLLCFVVFAFSWLCLVLVMSVFDLSSVSIFQLKPT